MATYYNLMGRKNTATSSFVTPSDWSDVSETGAALSSLTWADGDTAVFILDMAAHTSTLDGVAARINLDVSCPGKGSKLTLVPDGDFEVGNIDCAERTIIQPAANGVLRVFGDLVIIAWSKSLSLENISAVHLKGETDQSILSCNDGAGYGLDPDIPIVIDKPSGAVSICQYSRSASAAHDSLKIMTARRCERITLNDWASAGVSAASLGPVTLAGDVETASLILGDGVSADYQNIVEIPAGCKLHSDRTTWGALTFMTGSDSDSDGVRDSFGAYETLCMGGVGQDAAQVNYNIAPEITVLCAVVPAPTIIFANQISLPRAALDPASPVRLAEFNVHANGGAIHLAPNGTVGGMFVRTTDGPAWMAPILTETGDVYEMTFGDMS